MLVFEERGKPEYPENNLLEHSREPTNSVHIWRRVRESNLWHIGGRRVLSQLRHPCSPDGPKKACVLIGSKLGLYNLTETQN